MPQHRLPPPYPSTPTPNPQPPTPNLHPFKKWKSYRLKNMKISYNVLPHLYFSQIAKFKLHAVLGGSHTYPAHFAHSKKANRW